MRTSGNNNNPEFERRSSGQFFFYFVKKNLNFSIFQFFNYFFSILKRYFLISGQGGEPGIVHVVTGDQVRSLIVPYTNTKAQPLILSRRDFEKIVQGGFQLLHLIIRELKSHMT